MNLPPVPAGRAPVPPTFRSEIDALKQRIDELGRRGTPPTPLTPVVRVKLNANAALAASVDTYAQDGWIVGEDPDGWATLSASFGTNSYITVKQPGRYLCHVRGAFTSWASATTCVAWMLRGGNGIVRVQQNTANAGGDGTVAQTSRPVFLNAGDVITWGHWCGAAVTLNANVLNVPTEVGIYWLGTR